MKQRAVIQKIIHLCGARMLEFLHTCHAALPLATRARGRGCRCTSMAGAVHRVLIDHALIAVHDRRMAVHARKAGQQSRPDGEMRSSARRQRERHILTRRPGAQNVLTTCRTRAAHGWSPARTAIQCRDRIVGNSNKETCASSCSSLCCGMRRYPGGGVRRDAPAVLCFSGCNV